MMALALVILTLIAVLHFIYDGIILPSIRQYYRNRLFALRDELRWEMINGINNDDIVAFNMVHDAINVFVNRLPMVTISVEQSFQTELAANKKLHQLIIERMKVIDNCGNATIKRVAGDINSVLEHVCIANGGSWFFYLIPIAIAVSMVKKLAIISSEFSMAPKHEVHKLIPDTSNNQLCY